MRHLKEDFFQFLTRKQLKTTDKTLEISWSPDYHGKEMYWYQNSFVQFYVFPDMWTHKNFLFHNFLFYIPRQTLSFASVLFLPQLLHKSYYLCTLFFLIKWNVIRLTYSQKESCDGQPQTMYIYTTIRRLLLNLVSML